MCEYRCALWMALRVQELTVLLGQDSLDGDESGGSMSRYNMADGSQFMERL